MPEELTLEGLEGQLSPTQGQESQSEGTEDTQESSQGSTPSPQSTTPSYTDDEVTQILESDGKLDAKRLTPTQKLIQKSFEKHFNKRFQQFYRKNKSRHGNNPRRSRRTFGRSYCRFLE